MVMRQAPSLVPFPFEEIEGELQQLHQRNYSIPKRTSSHLLNNGSQLREVSSSSSSSHRDSTAAMASTSHADLPSARSDVANHASLLNQQTSDMLFSHESTLRSSSFLHESFGPTTSSISLSSNSSHSYLDERETNQSLFSRLASRFISPTTSTTTPSAAASGGGLIEMTSGMELEDKHWNSATAPYELHSTTAYYASRTGTSNKDLDEEY